jgi:hypothetical protein
VDAPGIAHSATAPAAKANFIDIENPPIAFDLDDIVSTTAAGGRVNHRVPRRRAEWLCAQGLGQGRIDKRGDARPGAAGSAGHATF